MSSQKPKRLQFPQGAAEHTSDNHKDIRESVDFQTENLRKSMEQFMTNEKFTPRKISDFSPLKFDSSTPNF